MSKVVKSHKRKNLYDSFEPDHFITRVKEEKRKLFRAKSLLKKKAELKKASQALSHTLSQTLSKLDCWKKNLTVATYRALPAELSTEYFQHQYQSELRFVFPKIIDKSLEMKFMFANLKDQKSWEPSPWYGGLEPLSQEEVPLKEIDVFFVPGLAFDREGQRLGRGKGFYDRVLCQAKGIKIGVAGTYQISNETLPNESQDIKMDAIATDGFLLVPLKESRFFKQKLNF